MFRNEYTMNRNFFKEYVFNILCKDIIIVGIILTVVSMIIYFMLNVTYAMFSFLFIVFFMLFCPFIMINNLEENSKRLNNGRIEKTSVDFNDNIIMNEGKVHLEFEYSQIKKIKQTKNFYVLMLSSKSAILVFKDGFTSGNKEEFLRFIEKNSRK